MDSHHEERINELLDNIRADERHNLNDSSRDTGSSNQNSEMNPGYRRKDDDASDRKDEMRSEAGPSTDRDWCNISPQWMHQKDEMCLDEGKMVLNFFCCFCMRGKVKNERVNKHNI